MSDALKKYQSRRDFSVTPEPADGGAQGGQALTFVIQKHWAGRLHYDFRLELDGVMKSWAVPKGPSYDTRDKRMAVHVEDHPIAYASFEGTIPEHQYGAGKVIIWDKGSWHPTGDPHQGYESGKLEFELRGHKMHGKWVLVRMKRGGEKREPWLLMKEKDEFARPAQQFSVVDEMPDSVKPLPMPATPKISNPERIVDAVSGATKMDMLRYYGLVSALMLPHLKGRPVSLVRAPSGVGGELFFQKHAATARLPGVRQLDPALDPGHESLLEVATVQGLLGAAQWNVLEFHTQNALAKAYETPNRIVFDLDPGKGLAWKAIQEGAALLRAFLHELGLPAFLKTSGGKGLHVVVPIRAALGWDEVKGFSQAVVAHLAQTIPRRFVLKSGPANRVGKIYVDYLRNGRGATTICAWSARARPGLGISVPVDWDELGALKAGDQWTVSNVHTRLDRGNEPWAAYAKSARGLTAAIKKLGVETAPPDDA